MENSGEKSDKHYEQRDVDKMLKLDEKATEFRADLVKAQSKFEDIVKGIDGQDGYQKYKYADKDALFRATKPHLNANNISVSFGSELIITHGDDKKAIAYYRVVTVLSHKNGYQERRAPVCIPVKDWYNPKSHGAACTYASRYSYELAVGIASAEDRQVDEDPKTSQKAGNPPKTQDKSQGNKGASGSKAKGQVKKITQEQAKKVSEDIANHFNKDNEKITEFLKPYGGRVGELTVQLVKKIYEKLGLELK